MSVQLLTLRYTGSQFFGFRKFSMSSFFSWNHLVEPPKELVAITSASISISSIRRWKCFGFNASLNKTLISSCTNLYH
ncbi:hypothetical protein CAEBREN_28788 [Caenorhabditis brenneri]|uniref:Uncharacterized protein n=1 Tax=Caenorhabditis brenneri TaxID=135651 RepID=G0P348_CAEBE|nr:hypothetical protein CAEBREN_28788 [Caenorhabditis brenneri]